MSPAWSPMCKHCTGLGSRQISGIDFPSSCYYTSQAVYFPDKVYYRQTMNIVRESLSHVGFRQSLAQLFVMRATLIPAGQIS